MGRSCCPGDAGYYVYRERSLQAYFVGFLAATKRSRGLLFCAATSGGTLLAAAGTPDATSTRRKNCCWSGAGRGPTRTPTGLLPLGAAGDPPQARRRRPSGRPTGPTSGLPAPPLG